MADDLGKILAPFLNPAQQDTSTIPVTIGLDVLEALIDMAQPKGSDDTIMLGIAYNAAEAAKGDI